MVLPEAYITRCILVESVILAIFISAVICLQWGRSDESPRYVRHAGWQFGGLVVLFILLSGVFLRSLGAVSPLMAIELAAGFTLSLLHPVNALCFFVHMLFLRPWELLPDQVLLLALPRLLAVVCFISWLMHRGERVRPSRKSLHALAILFGFSAWLFFSTFQASQVSDTQSAWFATYSKSPIILLMGLFFIENERSITQFTLTILISTLGLMVVGWVQFLSDGLSARRLGSFGLFAGPNELGALITMTLPFALRLFFHRAKHALSRIVAILYGLFSLGVIWYTRSRGALLALAVQAVAWRSFKRPRDSGIAILLLSLMLGVGFIAAIRAIPRSQVDMEESKESRVIYWKAALAMTLRHPITGVGFDQYRENYEAYSPRQRFEWGRRTAHSSWLLAFAEAGIPGGILYLAFFLIVLQTAWRNRFRWPDQFYALVGFAVGMTFLSLTYSLYFYILSGLILASDSVRRRRPHAA